MPDEDGYPDYEAFKNAVSERTAAFFVANQKTQEYLIQELKSLPIWLGRLEDLTVMTKLMPAY